MSGLSDENYLRAWAERADETAFRALVGRYAGFIYGAALRRVGDAGLAEEITQDVFARLSQNAARLVGHPAISGWLHRAAMLLALDRLRRRRRAEHRIAQLSQMHTPSADPLAEALPHLDEALDQLATRDREVLVLHFFERLTFPEIATRLGGSADAARMRTNRALSALSATLRKKGVTLSVTALSSGLGSTFAQAAPASFAIIPAALLGAGKVSALSVIFHALQTMKTAKAAALTALALVLATPLIFQQQQIAAAEARLALLEDQRATLTAPKERDSIATPDSVPTARKSGGLDLKQLGEDALDGGVFALRRIHSAIARLDNNNLAGLIDTVLSGGMLPAPRDKLLEQILQEIEKRDVGLHVEYSFKVLGTVCPSASVGARTGDYYYFARDRRSGVERSFQRWMHTDRERAEQWAAANRDEWRRLRGSAVEKMMLSALLASEPERAFQKMESIPVQDCIAAVGHVSANGKLGDNAFRQFAKLAAQVGDTDKRQRLVFQTLFERGWTIFTEGNRKELIMERSEGLLRELQLGDEDYKVIVSWLAASSRTPPTPPTMHASRAFPWLEKMLPPGTAGYAKGTSMLGFSQQKELFKVLSDEFERTADDDLIAGYVDKTSYGGSWNADGPSQGETAFRLAMLVRDPERRIALMSTAWPVFRAHSLKNAEKVFQSSELTDEERQLIQERAESKASKKQ